MYNTPIKIMRCVVDGYVEIVSSYQRNLIMEINDDFNLARHESWICAQRIPDSLHNLKSEPGKALQILICMKSILKSESTERKATGSLGALLRKEIFECYQNDSDALLFAELVIFRTIELAEDDGQFSELSHF